MVKIIWSEKSKEDLKQIYHYIYFRSPFYAKRTVQKTQILKHNVHTGKVVPEFKIDTIRELIEGNFRIVYQINNINKVEIVSIYHGRRDMTKLII